MKIVENTFIVVTHFILLAWMLWALQNTGNLSNTVVLWHFLGMAIYGGLLIRGTAYLVQRRYLKEKNQ